MLGLLSPNKTEKNMKLAFKPFSRKSNRSRRRRHFRWVFGDNFRQEVVSDVISGVTLQLVGMDVPVIVGDSRSNLSRDSRAADYVTNEHEPFYGITVL